MMLKRSLIYLSILIISFVIFYSTTYYWLTHTHNKLGRPIITEWQKELLFHRFPSEITFKTIDTLNQVDFLIIGSSHAYRNFNPSIFEQNGFTCFNIGSSSQTPSISYALLEQYISKCKNVIYEVYPVTLAIDGTEAFYILNNDLENFSILSKMAFYINNFRTYNLLSIHDWLKASIQNLPLDTTNFYKGYIATYDSVKPNTTYDSIILNKKNIDVQTNYIEKAILLCKKYNVSITLVYAPIPSKLKIENENYAIYKLNKLAKKHQVEFLNWGRNHNLNDAQHFFDDDHLNASGVALFNKHLLSKITKADE
ncbi:MAG: hypothetical protein ACK4IK_06985 [Bacteroidia bacterium]